MKKLFTLFAAALFSATLFAATYTVAGENPGEKVYYLKNNWEGGSWEWKATTKDGDTYKLENVVFGGNGVNYNTEASDSGSKWVPQDQFLGDKIGGLDTVTLVLDPVAGTITATLVGAYQKPAIPDYYLKNCWNGGDWTWVKMTYVDQTYKLENVVFGGNGVNWREGLTGTENWVPQDQFKGDAVKAKDTVTFVLDPVAGTITATLLGAYVKPADAVDTYFLKNRWDGTDWTWKEMTKDGDTYKLENVVFGGDGVNYNTEANDNGAAWVAMGDFQGDVVAAGDVVNFVLDPAAGTITVTLVGGTPIDPIDPVDPETTYYLKNNWNAAAEWTWLAMTKDGDIYKLENVVFGGTGVNYNTEENDNTASWVPMDQFQGDVVAAGDVVTFVLDPAAGTITVTLVGGTPVDPETTYYLKNNWNAGAEWTWLAMTKDGDIYKLENVVFGGTGVNYNTEENDNTASWVPMDQFQGDVVAAGDVVTFVLDPVAGTITVSAAKEGLEETLAAGKAAKVLRNGQIFIIKGDKMYNLMGTTIK